MLFKKKGGEPKSLPFPFPLAQSSLSSFFSSSTPLVFLPSSTLLHLCLGLAYAPLPPSTHTVKLVSCEFLSPIDPQNLPRKANHVLKRSSGR